MKNYANIDAFLADLPALAAEVKDKLAGQEALLKLEVGAKQVFVRLKDGQVDVMGECADKPSATVSASEEALLDMLSGKLNPMVAMFTGKVSVSGNSGALMSLMALLK